MQPLQLSPVKLDVLQHLKVDHVCLDVVVVIKVDLWIVRKAATHQAFQSDTYAYTHTYHRRAIKLLHLDWPTGPQTAVHGSEPVDTGPNVGLLHSCTRQMSKSGPTPAALPTPAHTPLLLSPVNSFKCCLQPFRARYMALVARTLGANCRLVMSRVQRSNSCRHAQNAGVDRGLG